MSYQGYSVKINGVTIPDQALVPKSYSLTDELRIKKKYSSGTGETKLKLYSNRGPIHTIKFAVKPGTESEYATIRRALAQKQNISVTYFDDGTGDYATGRFWLKLVTWGHAYENGSKVYYDKMVVTLVEY